MSCTTTGGDHNGTVITVFASLEERGTKEDKFHIIPPMLLDYELPRTSGEIWKRPIALGQGSLKILGLEVSDEGPEMEEAVIQPSIGALASINREPGATKPGFTIAGWNKRLLQIEHISKVPNNLPDLTSGLSLLSLLSNGEKINVTR